MISVCMIVKNEADVIENALSGIPKSFEIVVIDTGSTDDTIKICERYGAKIGHYAWNDDFSAARNAAINLASGSHILMLDADERLEERCDMKLIHFVETYPDVAGAVNLYNYIADEVHKTRMIRFFPNHPDFRFEHAVHEELKHKGMESPYEDTGLIIHHDGYQLELYKKKQKLQRYEEIYRNELAKHPNDGYLLYQVGKLYCSTQQWSSALPYLERARTEGDEEKLYYPPMLILYGYNLKAMAKAQQAWDVLIPYTRKYPMFPDLPFLLGLLAMEIGKFDQIERKYLDALSIGETTHYTSTYGVGSFKAAYNLGVFYEVTGNRNKASSYYEQSALKGFQPAIDRLTKLHLNIKK